MSDNESKVVRLRGAVPDGEPVPKVVELLEDMLAQAKAGKIRAVAIANVRADRTAGTAWEYPAGGELGSAMTSFEGHALGGAILTLACRFGTATNG